MEIGFLWKKNLEEGIISESKIANSILFSFSFSFSILDLGLKVSRMI